MKSVIEKQNFREIKETNDKRAAEILVNQQNELIEFLNDDRILMFESTLDNIMKYDTFKSYYDEGNTGEMDLKRTWVSNQNEIVEDTLICKRSVTNIEFPSNTQELLLGTYSSELGNIDSNEPNGLLILHNLQKKKPELVIKHQTEFTSSCFHRGNPKLIIAGTYTGQILVYDIRAGANPILKTPSSGKFHSLPIYCINNYGLDNSNQIISVSNDGQVCVFNISNFSKALKKQEVKKKVEAKFSSTVNMEDVGVICSAIRRESEYLYVGSDDSDIYQVFMGQSDSNENVFEQYKKHIGPVTSISLHPGDYFGNIDMPKTMLSSSSDWTMSLWLEDNPSAPLLNFDASDDYIYDCKWHPTNPSLFACVDGAGKLDFWDLNKDIECPVYRHDVSKTSLNKLSWSDDGRRIAVGDVCGKIIMYNLDKDIVLAKQDDAAKLQRMIEKQSSLIYKNVNLDA